MECLFEALFKFRSISRVKFESISIHFDIWRNKASLSYCKFETPGSSGQPLKYLHYEDKLLTNAEGMLTFDNLANSDSWIGK